MAIRSLENVEYIPLLAVRPAEMQALQSLPERDKDAMLPTFMLRPWASAHHLDSALSRLEDAYGQRPYFVTLAEPEPAEKRRPVHDELDALRVPESGYAAWCKFIEEHPNFIPAMQFGEPAEVNREIARLYEMDRGLMVPLKEPAFGFVANIADAISPVTNGGEDVCFLFDFERATKDILTRQMITAGFVKSLLERAPRAMVAISASSFPVSFGDVTEQEIYERTFFNSVREACETEQLLYSDRGSARAERHIGGGGVIPPRIDYAQATQWTFFRAEDAEDKLEGYREQANLAMGSEGWDPLLRIWGTQMIERTALGDTSAIRSPARSTAVRINIHLHRQLHYGDPAGLYDTDEEWSD